MQTWACTSLCITLWEYALVRVHVHITCAKTYLFSKLNILAMCTCTCNHATWNVWSPSLILPQFNTCYSVHAHAIQHTCTLNVLLTPTKPPPHPSRDIHVAACYMYMYIEPGSMHVHVHTPTPSSGVPPSLCCGCEEAGVVSMLVSMELSEATPFRHSVHERMARERRRIRRSSTWVGGVTHRTHPQYISTCHCT